MEACSQRVLATEGPPCRGPQASPFSTNARPWRMIRQNIARIDPVARFNDLLAIDPHLACPNQCRCQSPGFGDPLVGGEARQFLLPAILRFKAMRTAKGESGSSGFSGRGLRSW